MHRGAGNGGEPGKDWMRGEEGGVKLPPDPPYLVTKPLKLSNLNQG